MTKTILFSIFILLYTYSVAQTPDTKRDYIWLLGYGGEGPSKDTFYSNIIIDFKEKNIEAKKINITSEYNDDLAIISDTSGKLLFYTNGIYVADSTHQPMKNGEGLNPGEFAENNKKYGYILPQGALILPKPNSNNLFYIFHSSIILDTDSDIKGEKFYYTVVDMSKNNGKGEVIEKNKMIRDKFIDYGKITACRHANGTDWWITIAAFDTKLIFTYLFDKTGITLINEQLFPKGNKGGLGQAVFSPDGTKYARFNGYSLIENDLLFLYDFDRCTGKLSNQKEFVAGKKTFLGGAAFSRNSKYLYASESEYIYQIDADQKESVLKADTVAISDGVKPPESFAPTTFYLAQLAPDDKIYLSMTGSHKYLHVIHNPNEKGKACNVEQRGFILPTKNYTTMPNFPNFRLGAAATPCSTSSEDVATAGAKVSLYPNPASDHLTLDIKDLNATQLEIYDLNGKAIAQQSITTALTDININALPNGLYYCHIYKDKSIVTQKKFVVIR